MLLLDGTQTSQAILAEIAQFTAALVGRKPHLAAVLVGNSAASETYVAAKLKACEKTGIQSTLIRKPETITEKELLALITELNENPELDGFIVQLPLPEGISETLVIESIDPNKDVDGFHPINIGRMAKNLEAFLPATPAGVLELLKRYQIETKGKHCVVVGRSNIVGSPMSILMSRNAEPGNCTVTLCHRHTKNLEDFTRSADILIVAAGVLNLIQRHHIKPGASVIDVGIHRVADSTKKSGFRLQGDVEFEAVKEIAGAITPVPGGVGPMTIAMLLVNTIRSFSKQTKTPLPESLR